MPEKTPIDERGPVFISYRQSDGVDLAVETAWTLRAAGVPVWHDQTDLPPGDTRRRLREALASGLSGAVLLVTPEIQHSAVVRTLELPELLRLAEVPTFTLSVASTIERSPGKLDYDAPDRLLGQRPGTLSDLTQRPVQRPTDRSTIARWHARVRMQALRPSVAASRGKLHIDIQTRIPPFAARADSDLILRLRTPLEGERRPNLKGLDDLRRFLADLPELVALAGAEQVRIAGGAHLSVAYAIGAALPTTLLGLLEAVDTSGDVWAVSGNVPSDSTDECLAIVSDETRSVSGKLVIYLDLLPQRSDAAFDDLVQGSDGSIARSVHVRPSRDGNLDPSEATSIVGAACSVIREIANEQRDADVHLLLRAPWTVATLLGRTLNTLKVHLYEWENGSGVPKSPAYVESLVVQAGLGGSVVRRVPEFDRAPEVSGAGSLW
jgi:hypothetical protein